MQLNSKRKRIASKRALEIDDGKVVKEKGKNEEKENQPPEKKKKSNEAHQDQGQQDQGQKKKTQKQSLKLAKLMAEWNINSELLNKWIPGEVTLGFSIQNL